MAAEDIKIRITADGAQAVTAFNQVQGSMTKLDSTSSGVVGRLQAGWVNLAAKVSVFREAASIASEVYGRSLGKYLETGEQLKKVSEMIGISVEHLSGLKYAAELSETNIESLTTGVGFLSKSMGGINEMGETTREVFKALGIETEDINGNIRSTYDVFLELADSFHGMEDGAGKTSIAMRLLGRGGKELIPMLNEGSEGIKKYEDQLRSFGGVMSTSAVESIKTFHDNLVTLSAHIQSTFYPILNVIVDRLNSWFIPNDRLQTLAQLDSIMASITEHTKALHNATGGGFMSLFYSKDDVDRLNKELTELQQKATTLHEKLYPAELKETAKSPAPKLPDNDALKKSAEAAKKAAEEMRQLADIVSDFHNKTNLLTPSLSDEDKAILELGKSAEDSAAKIQAMEHISQGMKDTNIAKIWEDTQEGIESIQTKAAQKELDELSKTYYTLSDSVDNFIAGLQLTDPALSEADREILKLAESAEKLINTIDKSNLDQSLKDQLKTETWDATNKAIEQVTDSTKKLGKTTEEIFKEMQYNEQDTANALVDAFENIFMGNFKDGLDGLLDYFKHFLANMAATAMAQPIIVPIQPAMNQMGAGVSGIMGGGTGGFGQMANAALGFMGTPVGAGATTYAATGSPWASVGSAATSYAFSSGMFGGMQTAIALGADAAFGGTAAAMISTAIPILAPLAIGMIIASLFSGEEYVPKAQMHRHAGEDKFILEGAAEMGPQFTSAANQAMETLKQNLVTFVTTTGGDIKKLNEAWDSGSQDISEDMDTMALITQWMTEYTGFATGIDFAQFAQNGEKIIDTINRIMSAVITIGEASSRPGKGAPDVQGYYDSIDLTPDTPKEGLDKNAQAIRDAVAALKGLSGAEWGNKITEIGSLTSQRYEMEKQYLLQIKSIAESIGKSIDQQIEGFKLDTMSPAQKTAHYKDNLAELYAQLTAATDPAQVQELVTQIQQTMSALWGGLSEGEKNSSLKQATDFLGDVNAIAQEKLSAAVIEQVNTVAELSAALGAIDWSPLYNLTAAAQSAADTLNDIGGGAQPVPQYAGGTDYVYAQHHAIIDPGEAVITARGNTALGIMASHMAQLTKRMDALTTGGSGGGNITIVLEGDAGPIIKKARVLGSQDAIQMIRRNPGVLYAV